MGVYDDIESLMGISKKKVLESFSKNLKDAIVDYNYKYRKDIKNRKSKKEKLTQRLIAFDIFEDVENTEGGRITEGRMKSKFTEMKKGNSEVSIHYYVRICKMLNISLDRLFGCSKFGIRDLKKKMIKKCQQAEN